MTVEFLLLLAVGVSASLQTEARDGQTTPGVASATEISFDGAFRANEKVGGNTFQLGYAPHLLLTGGRAENIDHKATFSLAMPRVETLDLGVDSRLEYGRRDLSPIAPGNTSPLIV